MRVQRLFLTLVLLLASSVALLGKEYDLVVYGGTASGVITAVAAAREGASVALLEPGRHLGGMVTGGLSRTDYGKQETVGGYSLEFYRRAGRHYGEQVTWFHEPKVGELIFAEMIREAGVEVFLGHRLREQTGVKKEGPRILEIRLENGASFQGRIFADCSYEGDLMAQAKVSYTWGREGTDQYGESLAGVRPKDRNHQFDVKISAYDEAGRLLPEIGSQPRGELGAGDRKVQAYNFRLILCEDKSNQVPFIEPVGYNSRRYDLLAKLLGALTEAKGRAPRMDEVFLPARLKISSKADFNNRGAFSTDYIGANWDYPEADYRRRAEIWKEHEQYTKGLLYFMAHDPRVPSELQQEFSRWGLAADEFVDNQNWPYQLYVREARRMVGDFVMTQRDLQTDLTKEDVIGMGSYNSDSHNVQRFVEADGTVQNEGNMEVPVTPYQIPYRVILPKRREVQNLLVPVCFASSHVAYSSMRMEPVYMIIGQAAGVAARMAIANGTAVQDIDTRQLTQKLRSQGAVMEWTPPAAP
jgi:hypothetical protein